MGRVFSEYFGFPANFRSTNCSTFINHPIMDAIQSRASVTFSIRLQCHAETNLPSKEVFYVTQRKLGSNGIHFCMTFEVHVVVSIKIMIYWYVTLCSLVGRKNLGLHPYGRRTQGLQVLPKRC
jgi:hypothetical protein